MLTFPSHIVKPVAASRNQLASKTDKNAQAPKSKEAANHISSKEKLNDPEPDLKTGVEVFIGGLLRTMNSTALRELLFSPDEEIIEINLAREKGKRRCRGYGFVRYRTSEQANSALQRCREIEFQKGCFLRMMPSAENRTLFVSGIDEDWSAHQVCEFFHGSMQNVKKVGPIFNKEFPNRIRPFCFVEFYSNKDAKSAMDSHHIKVRDKCNSTNVDLNIKSSSQTSFSDLACQPNDVTSAMTKPRKYEKTQLSVAWAEPLRYYIYQFGRLGSDADTMSNSSTEPNIMKGIKQNNPVAPNRHELNVTELTRHQHIAAVAPQAEMISFCEGRNVSRDSIFARDFSCFKTKLNQPSYPFYKNPAEPIHFFSQDIQHVGEFGKSLAMHQNFDNQETKTKKQYSSCVGNLQSRVTPYPLHRYEKVPCYGKSSNQKAEYQSFMSHGCDMHYKLDNMIDNRFNDTSRHNHSAGIPIIYPATANKYDYFKNVEKLPFAEDWFSINNTVSDIALGRKGMQTNVESSCSMSRYESNKTPYFGSTGSAIFHPQRSKIGDIVPSIWN